MITKNGKTYLTISDVADKLGVTAKTVREYIRKKLIPKPPKMDYGLRTISYFSPEYIEDAKKRLDRAKKQQKEE
jgi:DNA-binding transcriptional MerR regulator